MLARKTVLRAKSDKQVTRDSLWEVCRATVLARDGYRCRMCGKSRDDGRVLQGAHILPKGSYRSMEFELENVITLCAYPCHLGTGGWHNDPTKAKEWCDQHLGDDFIPKLRQLAAMRKAAGWRLEVAGLTIYLKQKLEHYKANAPSS